MDIYGKKQNTKIVLKIKIKVNAKYDTNKQNRKIRLTVERCTG